MKISKLALAVVLAASASSALAAEDANNFYAQLNAGYGLGVKSGNNFNKTGKSFLAGFEAGARINENFRIGLEFDALPKLAAQGNPGVGMSNLGKTKISSYAIMANVFVNAGEYSGFKPYAVIGAGIAQNKTKDTTLTFNGAPTTAKGAKKKNFAFKIGVGTTYAINDSIDLDLRYQFVNLGKFTTKEANGIAAASGNLRVSEVLVGVAVKF